ncbi:MAG: VOC family protein [Bacteroidales bacterium]|nr:VOC family protein [Bacteroidales bacterium]
MKEKVISGIQQVGIGVTDVYEAWRWYKEYFGVDIKMFEEEAVAKLMLPYTGGQPRARHAILALNMQGGGGFEIWQYKGRTPEAPKSEPQVGDLGIFSVKIKTRNVENVYHYYRSKGLDIIGKLQKNPAGEPHFFIRDPFGNIFQVVSSFNWFLNNKSLTGAAYGAIIGVSDIEKSSTFYGQILGYDKIIYDITSSSEDLKDLPGGRHKIRRMLLHHSRPRAGAFSPIFGSSELELVQVLDRSPQSIFEGRYWGDLGFIHICFDIRGMDLLRKECANKGFPFTVDTGASFDMGEASGAFAYTEDPDGTLIEFVETHKIPILKKLGWYLNLRNRQPEKPLPRWLLKAVSFNRVRKIE